jgi:hypothetical protein
VRLCGVCHACRLSAQGWYIFLSVALFQDLYTLHFTFVRAEGESVATYITKHKTLVLAKSRHSVQTQRKVQKPCRSSASAVYRHRADERKHNTDCQHLPV